MKIRIELEIEKDAAELASSIFALIEGLPTVKMLDDVLRTATLCAEIAQKSAETAAVAAAETVSSGTVVPEQPEEPEAPEELEELEAPEEPEAPQPEEPKEDLDADGKPWDPEKHSRSKSKTKDGLWRVKRGLSAMPDATFAESYADLSSYIVSKVNHDGEIPAAVFAVAKSLGLVSPHTGEGDFSQLQNKPELIGEFRKRFDAEMGE